MTPATDAAVAKAMVVSLAAACGAGSSAAFISLPSAWPQSLDCRFVRSGTHLSEEHRAP